MNHKTRLTRRDFVKGTAAAALLLPFLPRAARAQAAIAKQAKRVILFHTPDGTYANYWTPLNPSAATNPRLNQMLSPLEEIKDHLTLIEGLSFPSLDGNHPGGIAEALTCGGTISLDQYIADRLRDMSTVTKVQALSLGVMVDNESVLWRGGRPTSDLHNAPIDAFNLCFGDVAGTPEELARRLGRRRTILDAVAGQLSYLRKQLGNAEQTKVDTHLAAIRDLEASLARGGTDCGNQTAPGTLDPHAPANFPAIGDQQLDILVNAMACDLTRVATLQWSHETNGLVPTWADASIRGSDQMHGYLSHGPRTPDQVAKLIKNEQWFAGKFLALVKMLKSRPEPGQPGQTMLDNSIVLWTRALGDGQMHTQHNVAYVLAGTGGGFLKAAPGGRYLNYGGLDQALGSLPLAPGRSGYSARPGEPHQRLFATVCRAMGIPDLRGFGHTGPYPSVDKNPTALLSELIA